MSEFKSLKAAADSNPAGKDSVSHLGEFRGDPPLIFRVGTRKTHTNPFLTGLCLGKNSISRVQRGLAPTKAGRMPAAISASVPVFTVSLWETVKISGCSFEAFENTAAAYAAAVSGVKSYASFLLTPRKEAITAASQAMQAKTAKVM